MEGGAVRHKFERDPPKDHPCRVWFNLGQRFQLQLSIAALVQVKMSSNINCSYMARNSLIYIPYFSVKFFIQPIYTDYAK
jgi:hypothetical protein